MAWNNNGGGRGRGGYGGGRGGPQFTPKPRPTLPEEHQLRPMAEAAIAEKAEMKDYRTRGDIICTETIVLEKDRTRTKLPVAVAALMAMNQMGIPAGHEDMPAIRKFDTDKDTLHYYLEYASPIFWEHDKEFRYIPCFTRYVMDKHGRVLNAYNGKPVEATPYRSYKLVPDGVSNSLTFASFDELFMLAYAPLPEGFRDFGFKTYTHSLSFDKEGNVIKWVKRPDVAIKDNEMNEVRKFGSLPEFLKCAGMDFELMKEVQQVARTGTKGKVVVVGPYSIKEMGVEEVPTNLPVVTLPDTTGGAADVFGEDPAPQQQASQQAAPSTNTDAGDMFDDDSIPF